ncbi:MAG: hypothetical protein JW881_21160 [Spirochaetales bacterium]|nr:hypothetical protein [Spirochaetales bacterium]
MTKNAAAIILLFIGFPLAMDLRVRAFTVVLTDARDTATRTVFVFIIDRFKNTRKNDSCYIRLYHHDRINRPAIGLLHIKFFKFGKRIRRQYPVLPAATSIKIRRRVIVKQQDCEKPSPFIDARVNSGSPIRSS